MNDVPLLVSDAVRLMAEADEVHRRHVGSFVYIYLRLVGKRWHWNIGAHIVTEHGVTVEFFQSGEAQGYRDRTVAELARLLVRCRGCRRRRDLRLRVGNDAGC